MTMCYILCSFVNFLSGFGVVYLKNLTTLYLSAELSTVRASLVVLQPLNVQRAQLQVRQVRAAAPEEAVGKGVRAPDLGRADALD
jgi:hypothetical protein